MSVMRQGNAGFDRFNKSIDVKTIVGINTHRQIIDIKRLICYSGLGAVAENAIGCDGFGDAQNTGRYFTQLPKIPRNIGRNNSSMRR